MRRIVSLIVLWGFMLSAGCQPNLNDAEAPPEIPPSPVAESSSRSMTVSPTQGDIQMTSSPPTPRTSGLEGLIEKAKADLAQRLSIPVSQISPIEAKGVVWPDSSLGCPQPGMAYAEVLTPGYLIILNAEDHEYEYHASRGTELIYCVNPTPPVPGMPGDI